MKENVFDNERISKQRDKLRCLEASMEEIEKCKNPVYFFNNYVLLNGQKHEPITQEEYDSFIIAIEMRRKQRGLKFRSNYSDRPLTPNECYKPKENDKT